MRRAPAGGTAVASAALSRIWTGGTVHRAPAGVTATVPAARPRRWTGGTTEHRAVRRCTARPSPAEERRHLPVKGAERLSPTILRLRTYASCRRAACPYPAEAATARP